MAQAINDAVAKLVKKDAAGTDDGKEEDDGNNSGTGDGSGSNIENPSLKPGASSGTSDLKNASKAVKTGDNSYVYGYAVLTGAALLAAIAALKKRKGAGNK